MAGEDGRDVEDDGSLFVGERVLRGGFVGKGIEPVEVKELLQGAVQAQLFAVVGALDELRQVVD